MPVYDEFREVGDDALNAGDVVVLDELCVEKLVSSQSSKPLILAHTNNSTPGELRYLADGKKKGKKT
jgi:hypothetical protein